MQLVLALALGTFAIWVMYGSRRQISKALASYRWKATEGTVVDSSDESFRIPGLDRWAAGVESTLYLQAGHVYEYQVDGRSYRSGLFCFGAHMEHATAAFSIGSKVTVYYNPGDPQEAVLKRGVQPSMFLGPILLGAAIYMLTDFIIRT